MGVVNKINAICHFKKRVHDSDVGILKELELLHHSCLILCKMLSFIKRSNLIDIHIHELK